MTVDLFVTFFPVTEFDVIRERGFAKMHESEETDKKHHLK